MPDMSKVMVRQKGYHGPAGRGSVMGRNSQVRQSYLRELATLPK
jgi:hypothetical protein